MTYQVSRSGQLYGPYSLEDLQRYVATGNVLLTDLAKSDDMPDWLPVSQVLAAAGVPIPAAPVPAYATPAYPANYTAPPTPYPDPPNLHWGLVLLFGILTCGVFNIVYDLIQTLWVKKVEPASQSLTYFIAFMVLEVINVGSTFGKMTLAMHSNNDAIATASSSASILSFVISIASLVLFIVYRFTMRADLLRHFNGPEPIGLRLSGIMTFFFGGLYFQYHFNRINEIKQSLRIRGVAV
jgi:hypothetical protein